MRVAGANTNSATSRNYDYAATCLCNGIAHLSFQHPDCDGNLVLQCTLLIKFRVCCVSQPSTSARVLQDAMGVARNICLNPRLVPGGGAVEMAVSRALTGQTKG